MADAEFIRALAEPVCKSKACKLLDNVRNIQRRQHDEGNLSFIPVSHETSKAKMNIYDLVEVYHNTDI